MFPESQTLRLVIRYEDPREAGHKYLHHLGLLRLMRMRLHHKNPHHYSPNLRLTLRRLSRMLQRLPAGMLQLLRLRPTLPVLLLFPEVGCRCFLSMKHAV